MRSSAKPFQAITCLEMGTADRLGWTAPQLAVVCASHSAEPRHQALVAAILEGAGLSPSDLQCGPHPPLDAGENTRLIRSKASPLAIHSNCSGKHAGMLACCRCQNWATETYRHPEHPLQVANRATIARFSGLPSDAITLGVDGCGVPTFALSMQAMATAFARLVHPTELPAQDQLAARRVGSAMVSHPELIAGTGRFDSELIAFGKGAIVAKSGAEGVFCAGCVDPPIGIALKVNDGSSRCHPAVVARVLSMFQPALGWDEFARRTNRPVLNTRGEAVGTIEACLEISP